MTNSTEQTRRGFLSTTVKTAAWTALLAHGVNSTMAAADAQPAPKIVAGPKPKAIDPNQTIRLGLVGVGGRSNYILDQLMDAEKNISIKAIADPHDGNRNQTANKIKDKLNQTPDLYSGPEDYRDKLLARDDIDALILAAPGDLHTPMYLDCFAAGKHFYGEKPMSLTVEHTAAMVAAQEKNPHVMAQIGFQRRATELYTKGVQMVRDGAIGKPLDSRAAWNNAWGPIGMPEGGETVWFGRRQRSGDWMLDQGCHTWDIFNWIAGGLPIAATGLGYRDLFKDRDPQRDVTDLYYAHVEYPGFIMDYEHSWICPSNDEGRFTGVFEKMCSLTGGIVLNEGRIFYRDIKKQPVTYSPATNDPLWTRNSIQAFIRSLRTGAPVVSGVKNGRDATLAGLLVRKAVDERRRVTMKEFLGA